MNPKKDNVVQLPPARTESDFSLEKTLLLRRSVREYANRSLSLPDLSQLLWAAQGCVGPGEYRTAPSAGATYPLEVYVVAARVASLSSGTYKYRPVEHELARIHEGNVLSELARASLGQSCVETAAAVIAFAAVYERTTGVYGRRGIRYVDNEIGHAAQNIHLQAVALGFATVPVGAFDDDAVARVLQLAGDEKPLYLIPVGRPR